MKVRALGGRFSTVVDLLREAAFRYPDLDAYVDGDTRLSFAEWDRAADGVAALLAAHGVGRGDVVCLMLTPSNEYAVAYQAAMRLGAISTGVNTRLGPTEVGAILARTEPKVVVCEDGTDPPPTAAQVLGRSDIGGNYGLEATPRPRLRPDDPVAIVWTSGSTGVPKGAVYDHVRLEAVAGSAGILSAPGDRRLATLAFAHVGYMTRQWDEISNLIANVIVPQPWRPENALAVIGREQVTVGQGTPTQWRMMMRHSAFAATDFSAMRIAGVGGASVPPELVREIRRQVGCPVIVRYASTEMCTGTGTAIDDPPEVTARTVGRPNPGVEVALRGVDGNPVAAGEVGEIVVRSAAVMAGYWRAPELTVSVLGADGWLRTGDLGKFDENGRLTVVGRLNEMYIRGGFNVYPAEVEAVLAEHPGVAEVAVVGVPDDVLGELGVAFVVPSTGDPPALASLRAWIRARLADYKSPDRLEIVESLPVTSMQKVDKCRLKAAATRSARPGSAS